ncbi:MAG TPA: hypothetical protein PKW49_13605, partial [Paludibacteraceae bacterium]|nr:hypothetical protein [Paludibacteraceae bacterium]HQF51249.1 hypothetical protein [Paludibacteraceae bacterium]
FALFFYIQKRGCILIHPPPDWRATNPLSGFRMCVRRIRLLEASKPDWRNHKKILLIENIQYIHIKKRDDIYLPPRFFISFPPLFP